MFRTAKSVENGAALLSSFLAMERELDLFSARERGIPFWEALRYPIYAKLVSDTGLQDYYLLGRARTFSQILRNIGFLGRALTTNNPYWRPKVQLLILSGAKRTLQDGLQRDIYTDPLLDILRGRFSFAVVERPFGEAVHKTPASNGPVGYLDFIYAISALRSRLPLPRLSSDALALCAKISRRIENVCGTKIDVVLALRTFTARWQVEVPLFRRLLRRRRPEALLVVVSAGNETLITAAKQLKIPCAELQHGSPAPGKLNYDFPAGVLKENFPDYFLSFGPFWSRHVHLPLPADRILPLGYPHMAELAERYRHILRERQIIFISQRTIGRPLAAFAQEVRRAIPGNIKMVYKLHPEEIGDWRQRYVGLAESGIEVIHQRSSDLYGLLAASTWQVGVYSTALYEGLAFGCRTFILKAPGWEAMQPLITDGAATLAESVRDIELDASAEDRPVLTKDYFAEVHPDHVISCIETVVSSGLRKIGFPLAISSGISQDV